MPLSSVVAAFRDQLQAEVPGAPPVGSSAPVTTSDIPRITISVEGVAPSFRGLGSFPAPALTGALRVDTTVDLADPVLRVGGEEVALLSGDRRTLQIPHGGVVRASGDDSPPFAAGDLLVRLGATTFAPVHNAPASGQVQLDVPSGALTFPAPLPATGTVELGYFVGMWELHVERFSATAHLDVAATTAAALETLSAAVEAALGPERGTATQGFRAISPLALSAATPVPGIVGAHRSQRLTYAVEFELIEPVIPTSGGPIGLVDVDSVLDPIVIAPVTESFEVT